MQVSDLFRFKNREIKALHLTWIAFFICFYVWFNMAPLASSMLKTVGWLTKDDIRLFAIANVALTIPARIIVGMALDRFGPRRVFSILMVLMAVPTLFFALGDTKEQLFVSRLILSSVGASFVVGIHMTALWFKPRDIGFAEGFYAGWGNFGSAAAAGLYGAAARDINDLRSGTNESYNFYNSKLVVTFLGIPTAVPVVVAGTGYKTTDLEINQAIKKAINSDAVLSKLLVAEDGPANSLVVKSLIDGVMAPTDLSVSLTTLTAAEVSALSATELAAVGAAYGITAPTAASVSAAITAAYTAFSVTNGDYATAMANDGFASITGRDSLATSDNLVLAGEGNDVIVLGTTVGTTAAGSSNETVVIGANFGNDTIVNFDAAGMGAVRLAPGQRRGLDGEHVVAVLFGGAHHGHRGILPGLEVGQRIDDECQFQGLAAAAEQVPLKMQLLGHAAGQASSASGAVRSSSMAAARQARRPTTP